MLLLLLAAASAARGAVDVKSLDGSVTVTVGAQGATSVAASGQTYAVAGLTTDLGAGGTVVSPSSCARDGPPTLGHLATVRQQWRCTVPSVTESDVGATTVVSVVVTDAFTPAAASVAINTTISAATPSPVPFSVALVTNLTLASARAEPGTARGDAGGMAAALSLLWTSWGKGCVQNNNGGHGMCFAGQGPAWMNPLTPEPFPPSREHYRYGSVHASKDSFSLPFVTLLDGPSNAGVSLALSPEDPILELGLDTAPSSVAFTRELLRLGHGEVKFSAHVLGHAACYRPAMHWFTVAFREFFEPWVTNVAELEGLGSYSWNQKPYNATRARELGFKTNWDLSGTFMPYDGLFLPYQSEWLNLGPINGGLDQYNVTYAKIESYYKAIQAAGFHSLSYFDIGNWGTRLDTKYNGPKRSCGKRPGGQPAPCPDPDGGNAYLRDVLSSALLREGWSAITGKFTEPMKDWVGTTDMDTQNPAFEDLIVEQAARHIEMIPSFEGIAIDRLDYSDYFNYDADDGTCWVPTNGSGSANEPRSGPPTLGVWGPARALRLAYRHTYNRLHEVLHPKGSDGGKVMLNNCNTLCRIDMLRAFDGTFSEGASINAVAWTGLRQPTILWTYDLADNTSVLHSYFQQHLLMNVYPMAPMPLNDHSINPGSAVVEHAYRDYAPLFDAMHGARWLLSASPVHAEASGAAPPIPNVLMLPAASGGSAAAAAAAAAFGDDRFNVSEPAPDLLVPVMLGSTPTARVTLSLAAAEALHGWPKTTGVSVAVLHPGSPAWLPPVEAKPSGGGGWVVTVPLSEGCAMLKVTLTSS